MKMPWRVVEGNLTEIRKTCRGQMRERRRDLTTEQISKMPRTGNQRN
jgi:hypothetical protein